MTDYHIQQMTAADVAIAVDWAGAEGWNPGLNDTACFYEADPDGFLIGRLGDKPISVISAVRYGQSFGFVGLYIVRPEYRGKGYGLKLWDEAMASLEGRNVGLDGVVEQQDNYRKSGFRYAYRNIRFEGIKPQSYGSVEPALTALTSMEFELVNAYDRTCFAEERPGFLRHWIGQPGAFGFGIPAGDRLCGYGVIRPCLKGFKVGPLFADSAELADRLLAALLSRIPDGDTFYLDVPEVNEQSVALADRLSMSVVFETARMYTAKPPRLPLQHIFGVTTFELG